MLEILDIRLVLLILSLLTNIRSTKVLSAQKKCGDPECETIMSRVLAIKDYTGTDCRYLNFKSGEEIMVYFKLSRKREDLWAGSKGKEFGYFPMDAVQIEELFVTKEVEVPTKETDFLCLDGGEYVFENEDSILNYADENKYGSLYANGKDPEFKMTEDVTMKVSGNSVPTEFVDSRELYSKSEDLHYLDISGDSELKDEITQQEHQISQALKPIPTQSAWTVFGIADWLGLSSDENEETARRLSKISEQVSYKRRKIPIADNTDFQEQAEKSEVQPHSWLQNTLTDLLDFGSEESGLGLLHKDNDPGIHSSKNTASDTGHQDRTAAFKTRNYAESDSEQTDSNWIDILTFGYTQKKFSTGKVADQNGESLPCKAPSLSIHDGMREAALEETLCEEQSKEKYIKKHTEQTTELVIDEELVKVKYGKELTRADAEVTDTEVSLEDKHSDFTNSEVLSFFTDLGEMLKSSNIEQDSIPCQKITENTQETERIKSQSGENVQHELDAKEKTVRNNLMNESYAVGNESIWLLLITHHLDDFYAIITSVFLAMTSLNKKVSFFNKSI